jgi:hypothetical protein
MGGGCLFCPVRFCTCSFCLGQQQQEEGEGKGSAGGWGGQPAGGAAQGQGRRTGAGATRLRCRELAAFWWCAWKQEGGAQGLDARGLGKAGPQGGLRLQDLGIRGRRRGRGTASWWPATGEGGCSSSGQERRRRHLFVDVQEEGEQGREEKLGPATWAAGM